VQRKSILKSVGFVALRNTISLGVPFASLIWLVIRLIIMASYDVGASGLLPPNVATSTYLDVLYLFFSFQMAYACVELLIHFAIKQLHRRAMYESLDNDDVMTRDQRTIAPYGTNREPALAGSGTGAALSTQLAAVAAVARDIDANVNVDKRRRQRVADDLLSAANAHATRLAPKVTCDVSCVLTLVPGGE
jgi:hypothetical protein